MAERSRRGASKLDALAEYKRARAGGKRILKEEDDQIYDQVSEEQYKNIVKGRLLRDDFVVEDGDENSGYVDNGEDWLDHENEESEEDEEEEHRKRRRTAKRKSSKAKASVPAPTVVPSMSAYRPVISAEQEEMFMSSLLGDLEKVPTVPVSRKRKSSPGLFDIDSSPDTKPYRSMRVRVEGSSNPPSDYYPSPSKKSRSSDAGMTPTAERMANLEVDLSMDTSYDDFFDDMEVDFGVEDIKANVIQLSSKAVKSQPVVKKEEEIDTKPSWLSVYDSLSVAPEESLGPLNSHSSSSSRSSNISALEPDGSLRFFWLDYLEHEGKLYFVGKLKDKSSGSWVSCCLTIEGLQRNLFVLSREKRVDQSEDGEIYDTDEVPTDQDVYDDFDMIRKEMKIKSWRAKFVERNYAFGEKEVPRGKSRWLKVVYGFNESQVPMNACSPNIAQIFGTNTSAFEIFVLKRKIMGPCWLEIKNPNVEFKGVSWCKFEVSVSNPKDVTPLSNSNSTDVPKEMPPLTVMSLSVRTIVNHDENKREIVCATARIWHNMQIDDATPPEQLPCTSQTFVRPLDHFPSDFEQEAKANNKGRILPMVNERMLLNTLLASINRSDPDVIVGHDFLGVSLDALLHRMRDLKADHWSRLGRFRRSKWPNIGKQGSNLKFLNGRMLCDLASDGAKSMISSTTWSLTEMCGTHLKCERQDIDPDDTASYFDPGVLAPGRTITFVRHCELDAHYQMAIAAKVQMLPLTKQLTNLAGNAWNKTLNGGRAERNEYILLHEFHRLKYICPDKTPWKKFVPKPETVEDGEGTKTKSKRDKYKGGLVFEPKRGLWDKFILVMDFNSLYPSIIQEYNIDFTTIERIEDDENGDERIPEPPPLEIPQGVLPRLIATLVSRRRQVKSLMKDRSATPAKLLQYDIKQQALKLTANSMYGCLGYENSRFYARPLAALTTYKGREILTHTKELAESMNLDVVYGDTDSVFVNSNVTELSEALKISAMLKKAVNDRYKLLEIDLDGVFQRLLLLQKKKYAAIKVEDGLRTSVEVKGLDMKRREYCALSKNVSHYVLERILSGDAADEVVESIHEYLTTIGENVRKGHTKVEDFIVFKRLGKNPEDYPDAKNQPHVQVALRMKTKGGSARAGDVIPYIFCIAEGEDSAKTAQADRAKHPDEVRKNGLKIDFEHYLSQQVLPPTERLCDPIEGTDRSRLAECLGLDPNRYRTSTAEDEKVFLAFDSHLSDEMRYKDASPFLVQCRHCQGQLPFALITDRASSFLQPSGSGCLACQKPISSASLQMQVETQIRAYIAKYYEGWTVCDDQTCNNRTRMMSVYGKRCLRQGCRGRVSFEYSDTQLYNQLRYFTYLFDGDKALRAAKGSTSEEEVVGVINKNGPLLRTLTRSVEKYLDQCGRRWIDLAAIFKGLKVK